MTTQHTHAVVFGRKMDGCPRCAELLAGAPPIKGWGQLNKEQEARESLARRNHNCRTSGCGVVCTFGDW